MISIHISMIVIHKLVTVYSLELGIKWVDIDGCMIEVAIGWYLP